MLHSGESGRRTILPDEINGLVNTEAPADSLNCARWLLIVVAILTVFGLTMLYSTSYNVAGAKYFQNQLMWVVVGTFGGAAAFFVGYRRVASWSTVWVGMAIVLLLIARFCFPEINGAHRWIRVRIPGMVLSIQPSELAKLALALFVARYVSDNLRTFSELRWKGGLLPLAAVGGGVLLAILIGRDLGTTVLAASMMFLVMLAAGLYLRYLFVPMAFVAVTSVFILFYDRMRLARVTSFMDPEAFAKTTGYQLYNSLLALGSGSWLGIGFMESRLKQRYLPEAHTDFILAIVGEELGLVAMVVLIILYGLFAWFGMRISLNASSRLGMLLGFALTIVVGLQAAINIAVIAGAAPTKGMPAPFISYGGSNMIVCLVGVGLLLSIAADTVHPGYNEEYITRLREKFPFLKLKK